MDDIKKRPLAPESYSLWVGKGNEMQRISNDSDNFMLVTHEVVDGKPGFNMVSSPSADAYMVQILAALHDHCASMGMIAKRTWRLDDGKSRNDSGSQKFSIPLGDDVMDQIKATMLGHPPAPGGNP